MKTPDRIPKILYKFFWDVNPEKINPRAKPYFVIQRLLDKGDVAAVRWVRSNFLKADIAEAFYTMRDFRAKVGYFWTLFLGLEQSKVICIQPHYLKLRRQLWPY